MRRRPVAPLCICVCAATLLLLNTGCSPTGPTWVDSGAVYTTQTLPAAYAKADLGSLANTAVRDSARLRHDALVALRRRGGAASDAADLITKTLPTDNGAVPVYVEHATINGVAGLVIVEAMGPSSGNLSTKELWALSDKGAVLFVGTR